MAISKIGICNLALASLGADSISTFSESNKRARMCDVFYDYVRDFLLAQFDWPFARAYAKLQAIADMDDDNIPAGYYPYELPADCLAARDLAPLGSRDTWIIVGSAIMIPQDPTGIDLYLWYTKRELNTAIYSFPFVSLLSLAIAIRIGPAITKDKKVVDMLANQFKVAQLDIWETEANIGEIYRDYDNDPNNDTFVDPDKDITPVTSADDNL